jgi:Protein of unknown function (DUF3616)
MIRFLLLTGGILAAGLHAVWAQEPRVRDLEPSGLFDIRAALTDDKGKPGKDLSGIACMPPADGARTCLVIDDQGRFAQFASIEGNRVAGGAKLPLIGKKPSDATLGRKPKGADCSEGKAKFADLDGEGVAFAAPYFYIAGSHGCSRHGNKFILSSFMLARVRVDRQGRVADQDDTPVDPAQLGPEHVETTYRLAATLRTAPRVGGYFGRDLNGADGLNIEGIAVSGVRLIAGLRAPVVKGNAFLVSVKLDHLFSRDSSPPPADIRVIPLQLGKNAGVRDLAALDDRRLLVLAGPAQEQKKVRYGVFLVDLASSTGPEFLATLADIEEDGKRGKAEGILILEASPPTLRVGILFDSLPSGGMREYQLPLP